MFKSMEMSLLTLIVLLLIAPFHYIVLDIASLVLDTVCGSTTIHFSVGLNAYLDCNLCGQLSINVASRSADGSISLTPRVRVVPEGGASLTFLV